MKFIVLVILINFVFSQENLDKIFYQKIDLFEEVKTNKFRTPLTVSLLSIYNDSTRLLGHLSYRFKEDLTDNFKLYLSANILYQKDYMFNQNKQFYAYKEYFDSHFYLDEAYIQYKDKYIDIDFGRFIDKIGVAPFDNLLIGDHDYHDGYRLSFTFSEIIFSTRYYQLSPYLQNKEINRYFVQHGIEFFMFNKKLNIQFHESATIAGLNSSIPISYLNPLIPYYSTQVNDKYRSNIYYTFLTDYQWTKNFNLWFEFFLDDIQFDSSDKDIRNNEPTEFGMIFGTKLKLEDHRFLMNLTLIRNRTYNDNSLIDGLSYTKFIDHGKIIGYQHGSNLINFQFYYQYFVKQNNYIGFEFNSTNKGNESVFGPFDESFLNKKPSFFESIPYGEINSEYFFEISYFKKIENYVGIIALEHRKYYNGQNNLSLILNLRYEMD